MTKDEEQFEAWWLTKFSAEFLDSDNCHSAWTGWQARGELDAVRIAELEALAEQPTQDTEHKCEGCVKCDARCLPTQELNDLLTYGQSFEKEGKSIPIDEVYYPPKQEPMIIKQDNGMVLKQGFDDLPNGTPFYTHPSKQWQGLSDDEIDILHEHSVALGEDFEFARAIEAKLREKNDA